MIRSRNLLNLALIVALAVLAAGPLLTGCSLFKSKEPPPAAEKEPATTENKTPEAPVTPVSPAGTQSAPATTPEVKAADLLVADIDWVPRAPKGGEAVTFTIVIQNRGGTAAGDSRVAYLIDDVPVGEGRVPAIPAGDKVTKQFVWRVERQYFRAKVNADSTNTVAESDETNNMLNVMVSDVGYADLAVTDIKWLPVAPSAGDNVTFTASLANHGQGQSAPATLAYYADGALIGEQNLSPLAAGDTTKVTFNWVAVTGSHVIKAVASSSDPIMELGEDNNTKEVTLTNLSFTDLVVDAIVWLPQNAVPGQVITITATIKNLGGRPAEPSVTDYYLDDHAAESIAIAAIAAGDTAKITFTTTGASGSHYVSVVADSYSTVPESNEANNQKRVALSNVTFADLTVDSISWYPANPSLGETVNISAIVKNISPQSANTTLEYFYIDDTPIGAGQAGVLEANASANVTVTWKAELGIHIIRVVADATEVVPEVSETNNRKEVTFPGARPVDLIIDNISWSPLNPFVDENMTISVTVRNQDTGQAPATKVSLEVDGRAVGTSPVPTIAPGGTSDVSFSWRAASGAHTFKARVDPNNQVREKDETNNELVVTFSGTVVPRPDLAIVDVTWSPQEAFAGQTITFTVTLQNLGAASVPPSYLAFEVDGVRVKLIRIFTIAVGGKLVETFTWNATSGTHQLRLTADAELSIVEIDKVNNTTGLELVVKP